MVKKSTQDDEETVVPRSRAREVHPITDLRKDGRRDPKDFRPNYAEVAEPDELELAILEQQLELELDPEDLQSAEGESPAPKGKVATSN